MDDKVFDILTKHIQKQGDVDVDAIIKDLAPYKRELEDKNEQSNWLERVLRKGFKHVLDWETNLDTPIPTGIRAVDGILSGGLRPREVGLLVGLPEHGKTRTLCNFAAAALGEQPFAYCCLEQPWEQVRKFIIMAKLDLYESEVTWQMIKRMKELEDSGMVNPIDMSDRGYKVSQLGEAIAALDGKPAILFVDYLDLLEPDWHKVQLRWEYDATSKSLARMAKANDLAMWTATQADIQALYRTIGLESAAESKIGKTAHISVGMGIKKDPHDPTVTHMNVFKMRRRDMALRACQVRSTKYRMYG